MSKKTITTIIQLVVFLGLGIGLMLWRYNDISAKDKADMFEAFGHIRWWWTVPLLVVGFLSHYFRALRWKMLMQPLKVFPSIANTVFAVLIGYLANALIPRLGEVAKCTILAKYEKVPADQLVGTIIAERAFDLACLIIILVATLFLQFDIIYPFAKALTQKIFLDGNGNLQWLRFGIAIGFAIVAIYLFIRLTRTIRKTKIGKIIRGIGDGLKSIGRIKQKGRFLLYTALIWMMYTGLIIIGFWAMPEMDGITLLASLAILTFGSVGMIATPGGIGTYPVIIAEVLILYGISSGIGFAYGWVSWAGQTAIVLVLGLSSLILLPLYNRNKENGKQKGSAIGENSSAQTITTNR